MDKNELIALLTAIEVQVGVLLQALAALPDNMPLDISSSVVKKCSSCKKYLPLDNFVKSRHSKDGYYHYCKTCVRGKTK